MKTAINPVKRLQTIFSLIDDVILAPLRAQAPTCNFLVTSVRHRILAGTDIIYWSHIITIIIITSLFRTRYIDIFIKIQTQSNFFNTIVLGTLQNLHDKKYALLFQTFKTPMEVLVF